MVRSSILEKKLQNSNYPYVDGKAHQVLQTLKNNYEVRRVYQGNGNWSTELIKNESEKYQK